MSLRRSFVLIVFIPFCLQQTVKEMEELIEQLIENATTYTYPHSSRKWFPEENSTPLLWGEFDFIVVGVGASGSVLIDRLTEDEKFTVLALEAGDFENDVTDIPAFATLLQHTDFNWGYKSTPQQFGCLGMEGQRCDYARGKAVGGSTVINYMFYNQGNREDFNHWESLGNPGWGYQDISHYFKQLEEVQIFGEFPQYHGHAGPIPVRNARFHTGLEDLYFAANFFLGNKVAWDVHPDNQLGFAPIHSNIESGRRISGGRAFIQRALSRNCLRLLTNALATRILIHQDKAHGVEFLHRGQKYYAVASKEVVVSAGAINTPQLLMLSGIGPQNHLKDFNINPVKNLPVGNNLQDHPVNFHMFFATNLTMPPINFTHALEEYLNEGTGVLTLTGGFVAFSFFKHPSSLRKSKKPDIEHAFALSPVTDATYDFYRNYIGLNEENSKAIFSKLKGRVCWSLATAILHPKSNGTVRLASRDARDFPLIDPMLLSDPQGHDLELMLYAIKQIFQLAETPMFQQIGSQYLSDPLPSCNTHAHLSDDYWRCALRQLTTLVYHPSGTCRMGPDSDPTAVVDPELRVRGLQGLRIADCSIMPTPISGHPTATAFMIGAKAANMLRAEHSTIYSYLFGNT